jgi:hypothetical protein
MNEQFAEPDIYTLFNKIMELGHAEMFRPNSIDDSSNNYFFYIILYLINF